MPTAVVAYYMPQPPPHSRASSHDPAPPSSADIKVAETLRNKSPELAVALDSWIKEASAEGSRAISLDVFLAGLIREAKASLDEEKADLAMILATENEEAVLILNTMGVITGVCKHSGEILGREENEIIGKSIDSLLDGKWRGIDASSDEMARAAGGERVHSLRVQRRDDGSTFESKHTIVALVGRLGEVSGFARSIEDISKQRLHEVHIDELNASVALMMHPKK